MTIVAAIGADGNTDRILVEAIELATALGEDLHVVHVKGYSELKDNATSNANVNRRTIQQQIQDDAARIASSITEEFTLVGRIGKPASEVVSYTESVDGTHLMIGGRKQSPVGKAMFGSTTQKILLNAPCPVVTTLMAD